MITPQAVVAEPSRGQVRTVIENVTPSVDGGRFAVKRVLGDSVCVEADVFTDGHDVVCADVLYRHESDADWIRVAMVALGNDRFQAAFKVERLGRYVFRVRAWTDTFATWRRDLEKRREADDDLGLHFLSGAAIVQAVAARASKADKVRLLAAAAAIGNRDATAHAAFAAAREDDLLTLVRRYPDPTRVETSEPVLGVIVDRERARYSTWYELFPRSCSRTPSEHGTLRDCESRLAAIAAMGFDVLYLPPIHPIGLAFRKGPNNTLQASPEDVGSPWAIGAAEGGHKAIHPQLGTIEDFRSLRQSAATHGIEIALDIAFQCSPDHPYVKEHPEWFLKRPDGSIQYAENPPKKYQDIYPFYFESEQWPAMWRELKSVVDFWIGEGVRIFRVDNPHTKPYPFWEWLIGEVKHTQPEVIFLAEAFTRPKVMHRLAKLGFTQSYTYFTWRNTKRELTAYFEELNSAPSNEYFRPNLWPNTPDILTEYLQYGGRPAFMIRLVLAATLGASYGIYGPAFELCEAEPRDPGGEEYRDSEKYQIRAWDLARADSLAGLIERVNRIRRQHRALQSDADLTFHAIENEQLIAYSKKDPRGEDVILTVVNLDPFQTQGGVLHLPLEEFGIDPALPFQMHDLLSGARYLWQGGDNTIVLDPRTMPAHVFRVRRRLRREHDFDYFM